MWTLLRHSPHRRAVALAGPVALAAVVCSWATLLLLGWALIYLPQYPHDFVVGARASTPLVGAIHVSLATLTTLGSSSAAPGSAWLEIGSPLEALIGFGLKTAAVAYLLQLDPVLSPAAPSLTRFTCSPTRSAGSASQLLRSSRARLHSSTPSCPPG